MKKSVHIVIALVLGIFIGSASNVFAKVGAIVEAQFAKFTFLVDGQEQKIDADPIVYQGSTYLPVRTIANMLGKDVVYRADTRTIELNTPSVVQKKEGKQTMSSYDYSKQRPELIHGTIQAMKAELDRGIEDPEQKKYFETWIENAESYLRSIGWDENEEKRKELEEQLRIINSRIESTLDFMRIEKDNAFLTEKLQKELEEYKSKKAELEAQLRELQK